MVAITKQAEAYLEALAKALEIPSGRYEQAERSYKSLGDWFHRNESRVVSFGPDVLVQGSFRLGTVIKPQSESEEYDVDCACVLTKLNKQQLSQAQLKALLGEEIRSYRKNKGIAKEVKEKRRCWRLEYADGAQFHMDVVPSVPNGNDQRRLLEDRNLDAQFADTAIAITDTERRGYHNITADWPRSNPRGYANWFMSRMGDVFIKRREQILNEMRAEGANASVEDIPIYRVRTPLQSAIMILKRHRDVMFADNFEEAPISIIISTLAAHAYNGEETIGSALLSILSRMEKAIEYDGQKYIIRNPTDALENFADKWEENSEKALAFFAWLERARENFGTVSRLVEHQRMSNFLADRMGLGVTNQATEHVRQSAQVRSSSLLHGATAASSTSAPNVSFSNAPRTPKKPEGFA